MLRCLEAPNHLFDGLREYLLLILGSECSNGPQLDEAGKEPGYNIGLLWQLGLSG